MLRGVQAQHAVVIECHLIKVYVCWYDGGHFHFLQFVGARKAYVEDVGLSKGRSVDIFIVLVELHAVAIQQVEVQSCTF